MGTSSSRLILQSGLPSLIRGAKLKPVPHPRYTNIPWYEEGKQGLCYYLQASNQSVWVLKKFHNNAPEIAYLTSIRTLLPSGSAFSAGLKRALVTSQDIKPGEGIYHNSEFVHWVEQSVLMPKLPGVTWNRVAQELRKGTFELPFDKRLMFAQNLAEAITNLEENGCAHRDLSHQNLLFDVREYIIYMVDWDSMFHGSLYFHKNLPFGTEGYLPPWVFDKTGKCDVRKTWQSKADRFSLAILLSEILTVQEGSPSYQEGSLFSQDILRTPEHPELLKVQETLARISSELQDLFLRTLTANDYDNCPKPREWQDVLTILAAKHNDDSINLQSGDNDENSTDTANTVDEDVIPSKLNIILLFLIILFPFICWGIYQFQKNDPVQNNLPNNTPTNPTSQNQNSVPTNLIVTPNQIGTVTNEIEYRIEIEYPDKDLQMFIDAQPITLDNNNSARVKIKPGEYNVALVFSSIFFDRGNPKKGPISSHSQKIRFEPNKTRIKFSIDREQTTWEYRTRS